MTTPAESTLPVVSTEEILAAFIALPEYSPPHNSLAHGLMPDGTPYSAASRADQVKAIEKALADIYLYEERCEKLGQQLSNLPPTPSLVEDLAFGL